jgi:hypothetical protein
MSAKLKLNSTHFLGCTAVSGLIGLAAESLVVFALALAATLAASYHTGDKNIRARTGILVHLTAPTIHAGRSGNITLEIANVGPFHFALQDNDMMAQLTVAVVMSPPDLSLKTARPPRRSRLA